MPLHRHRATWVNGLLAAGLLVLGQNAAALHPGEHEDGLSRGATCAACLVVNLLSSAVVDTAVVADALPQRSAVATAREILPVSLDVRSPRQRAPPRG